MVGELLGKRLTEGDKDGDKLGELDGFDVPGRVGESEGEELGADDGVWLGPFEG